MSNVFPFEPSSHSITILKGILIVNLSFDINKKS